MQKNKNYSNTKSFISSYNTIYIVEIIDNKIVVSENREVIASLILDIENPIKFKNKLYIDPYSLLDQINTVRGLFTVFKQKDIILSPKLKKDEIK